MNKKNFKEWLEEFPYESMQQRQGFGNLLQFLRPYQGNSELHSESYQLQMNQCLIVLWQIQKDHEAQEWLDQMLGEQLKQIREEMIRMKDEIADLKGRLARRS